MREAEVIEFPYQGKWLTGFGFCRSCGAEYVVVCPLEAHLQYLECAKCGAMTFEVEKP